MSSDWFASLFFLKMLYIWNRDWREALINHLFFTYRTYDKIVPDKKLNSTFTKPTAESESYDMTPSRDEMPPQPLKDEDNYDIGDLKSDEVKFAWNARFFSFMRYLSEFGNNVQFHLFRILTTKTILERLYPLGLRVGFSDRLCFASVFIRQILMPSFASWMRLRIWYVEK